VCVRIEWCELVKQCGRSVFVKRMFLAMTSSLELVAKWYAARGREARAGEAGARRRRSASAIATSPLLTHSYQTVALKQTTFRDALGP